jgi:hypothetical protein
MVNRSGVIGTKTETAVVKVLQANGFPHAERRRLRGRHDPGDITGTPGIAWSVKGGEAARKASDALIAEWLDRAEDMRRNTDSDHAVLVVARKGIGYDNASQWWAILRTGSLLGAVLWDVPARVYLVDACRLLRADGYGDPLSGVTDHPYQGPANGLHCSHDAGDVDEIAFCSMPRSAHRMESGL